MSTVLTTTPGAQGQYVLFPSQANQSAYLADGSLIFLVSNGNSMKLYQCANPSAPSPSASLVHSFAPGGAGENSALFVAGADVFVGIAENDTTGGAWVAHSIYSAGVWGAWDGPTSCVANLTLASQNNEIELVWTGTYLIVVMRGSVAGAAAVWLNYTTDKTGVTGWLTTAVQLSATSGVNTHYFASLLHDATLGCTVAVYSVAGDPLKSRVLPDASSPALVNWGAETDLGVGNLTLTDFQGAAALLDHPSGRVFVLYCDQSVSPPKSPGFLSGTVTVNGTSSAVTWGSPVAVGAASATADSPSLSIDSAGTVYLLWASGITGNASDIFYASSVSPYTSVSTAKNLTNASANHNNHPATPRLARLSAGYVPVLSISGTGAPYNVVLDTSIAAGGTGGLLLRGVNT